MSEWSHFPNAKHIVWILASLQANPEKWRNAYNKDAAKKAAWNTAWSAASDTVPDVVKIKS
jgi:hypothetical protein